MLPKPLVGITCGSREGIATLNRAYITAIEKAGLSCCLLYGDSAISALPQLSGIVFSGGGDIDPSIYGGDMLAADNIERERDDYEIEAVRSAIKTQLPILGICRGLQVINIACGGTLLGNITGHSGGVLHSVHITDKNMQAYYSNQAVTVNSYHHQAIDKLGENLSVCAVSQDGIVEAVCAENLIAVQWHPERLIHDAVFDVFARMCYLFLKD